MPKPSQTLKPRLFSLNKQHHASRISSLMRATAASLWQRYWYPEKKRRPLVRAQDQPEVLCRGSRNVPAALISPYVTDKCKLLLSHHMDVPFREVWVQSRRGSRGHSEPKSRPVCCMMLQMAFNSCLAANRSSFKEFKALGLGGDK